jgi:hypothetical protein
MADDLVKVLEKAKYSALPLPRSKAEPTAIFTFTGGKIHVVRNPHSCLPDPPIAITEDASAEILTFSRSFELGVSGLLNFLGKVFGLAGAKAQIDVKKVSSATVQLSGLAHHTIETGALLDYLLTLPPKSSCWRDLGKDENLTVVAALKANSFTYTFHNKSGAVVKFTVEEARQLFKADASVSVESTADGSIVVNAPTFIGFIAWDGKKMRQEREKAQQFRDTPALAPRVPRYTSHYLIEGAVSPAAVHRRVSASAPKARRAMVGR